jgi:hypothetical protein
MDADEVRRRILQRYGIRVEAEMGAYALKKLERAGRALRKATSFHVMGGDARTGVPVRLLIDPTDLTGAPQETLF